MLSTHLIGLRLGDWCRLLRENRFAVEPAYWPKAAWLTAFALRNSVRRMREARRFGAASESASIRPPLFIIGHWRGGTTHLHNLITTDPGFTYPDVLQVFNPHTFLLSGPRHYERLERFLPATRSFDRVPLGPRAPAEDEFATAAMTLRSPLIGPAFPRHAAMYNPYLTFRGVPDAEVDAWGRALVHFMKKLTLLNDRPIALKSPQHTCRIKILLRLFPEARFLHIRREPYALYQSTLHMESTFISANQFHRRDPDDLEARILSRYRVLYEAYFEERALIPPGRLHELSFEELERDPIGQVESAYGSLGLPGLDAMRPRLEEYVARQAGYQKNAFRPIDPDLKRRIAAAWGFAFDEFGYDPS